MKIYVGNLTTDTTEEELRQAFAGHGQVTSVKIIKDRDTFESRGFGFVEMPSKVQAQEAMKALNGADLRGNHLTVNEAREREDRSRGFSGGGNRGGYGGRRF